MEPTKDSAWLSPVSCSSPSEGTTALLRDRAWSNDTATSKDSKVSHDTEQTELGSPPNHPDDSDTVFSHLEYQLHEVSQSVQKSFQLVSPVYDPLVSNDRHHSRTTTASQPVSVAGEQEERRRLGAMNEVFQISPSVQRRPPCGEPTPTDGLQLCWINNSPASDEEGGEEDRSSLIAQKWREPDNTAETRLSSPSQCTTTSAPEEFYSCYSGGGSTDKILSPLLDRSVNSSGAASSGSGSSGWPKSQLEMLLQEIDASYQQMLKEDEKAQQLPEMRTIDVQTMMMSSNQREPLLVESPELIQQPPQVPSPPPPQQPPLQQQHQATTNGITGNRQYSRGSSCELQEERGGAGVYMHNGHLCPSVVPLASMDDLSDAATSLISHNSGNGSRETGGGEGGRYVGKRGKGLTSGSGGKGQGQHAMQTSLDSDSDIDDSYSLLRSSNLEHKDFSCDMALPTLNGCPSRGAGLSPQVVEVNHTNTHLLRPPQTWIEKGIQSAEDLERIFVSHQEEVTEDEEFESDSQDWDFLEFAVRYFALHTPYTGLSNSLSKTVGLVKRRSQQDIVSPEKLAQYTRSNVLPTSLIRLLNPANVPLAQNLFKDICRYMHSDLKLDSAFLTLREIVATGIDNVELRDEIYCQLMRQCRCNPLSEACAKLYHIMSLCAMSFYPSKTLKKYLLSHLRQNVEHENQRVAKYVQYCLQCLTKHNRKQRIMPPAFPEIEAVLTLQQMVHPVHFLDGRCELLETSPDCLAVEAVALMAKKIGLEDSQGWALYESTPEYDKHIHNEEYLADIISKWEQKQRKLEEEARAAANAKKSSQGKKGSPIRKGPIKLGSPKLVPLKEFGKLVFCKRMFQPLSELTGDPMELQLMYSQAAHYAVQLDEYNLSTSVAIHLAGLQAHVEFGEYEPDKYYRYDPPSDFICERLLQHSKRNWINEIAAAHKKYGAGKSHKEAMLKYLTIVSQFPLYGCTKIFAHYRGIWPYGAETVLAVDFEGIKFISIQEKTIAFSFYYSEVEHLNLEERRGEYYIVIQLKNYVSPAQQKCFLFECLDLEEFAKCIEYHSPLQAIWLHSPHSWRHRKFRPPDDWLRLSDQITACRRTLIQKNIVRQSSQGGPGLLRNALNRFSQRSPGVSSRKYPDSPEDSSGDWQDLHNPVWSFSRLPFKSSILNVNSHEMEDVAARMFNSTLVYTGLESAAILEDMDLVVVVQTLIIKCLENDDLCNELYLQLIKQTTNTHAELNQTAVLRYWHLMTMATCVMFPPNPVIFNYLTLHLKRYAMQCSNTDPGLYALFCVKCLYRTQEGGGRKWPPSFKEIDFVTNRQAIEARVSLPDGHQMLVEFDSASTCSEVIQLIKAKAGMRLDSQGFGIYMVLGEEEQYIEYPEKLADALHQWEKWAKNTGSRELKFLFKKRLFIDPFMNTQDPVEVDLLYHQSVTDLFDQKIPLTKTDAVDLCALRAQAELGDFGYANNFDYKSVMRILPRHLRDLIQVSEVSYVHKKLQGTSPMKANISFMETLRHWPLYGATIFEVSNNNDSLPKNLWLAVTQMGVHLMERRGQHIFFTYSFKEICDISPGQKNLTLVVGNNPDGASLYFATSEAKEIVQLVLEYRQQTEGSSFISVTPMVGGGQQSLEEPGNKIKRNRKRKESGGQSGIETEKRMGYVTDASESETNDIGNLEYVTSSSVSNVGNDLSLLGATCFTHSRNKGSMEAAHRTHEGIDLAYFDHGKSSNARRVACSYRGSQQPLLIKESPSPIDSVKSGSQGRLRTTVCTDL